MSAQPVSEEEAAARTGEGARLLSYVVVALVAAVLFLRAGALPASQWEPLGAGAFPRLVLGALAVLCTIAAVGSLRRLDWRVPWAELGPAAVDWAVRRRLVFAVVALFAVYLALIRGAGFGLATLLFLLAGQALLAPRSLRAWGVAAVLALLFSFGLAWLFASGFNVFLPRGRWW